MKKAIYPILPLLAAMLFSQAVKSETTKKPARNMAEVLGSSKASDWRSIDTANTLYLELASGRVVIELAPDFAPAHVANIKALVKEGYFDGLAIIRSHDNYVVQWGDPAAGTAQARKIKTAKSQLTAEFSVPYTDKTPFTVLPDSDGYAPQVGHSNGFAAARDPKTAQQWLTHCYGAVGVARGGSPDSGSGTGLYVVTGHAPRHLDRNITVVGRVVNGIELLSTLPRGSKALGFYEHSEQHVPLLRITLAADSSVAERSELEILRTDTALFQELVNAQRNRQGDWFKVSAGYIELCNVPVPVRQKQ